MESARMRIKGTLVALVVFMPVTLFAQSAQAGDWTVERAVYSVFDVVAFRPLSLSASLLGAVTYSLSAPVSYPLGTWREQLDGMILTPLWQTFRRPLGKLPDPGEDGHPPHTGNLEGCVWYGCFPAK